VPLTTDWKDLSGKGNDGTLTGFGVQTPWAGSGTIVNPYSVVFDGVNDRVALSPLRSGDCGIFTHEAYVKIASPPPTQATIICELRLVGSVYNYCELTILPTGYVQEITLRGAGSFNINGTTNVCDGAIHHILCTSDGGYVNLYIDGILQAGPILILGYLFTALYASVGCEQYGASSYDIFLPGSIFIARVYPFALNASQVAQNFAAGPQGASGVWGDGVTPGAVLELVAAYGNAFVGG
jgi:hypothetical protein